ncbi:hypothetical protein Tco_0219322, partial [Tanacetum coccineum]
LLPPWQSPKSPLDNENDKEMEVYDHKDWALETDIQQKDENRSQKRQNRARSGKAWKNVEKPMSNQSQSQQNSKSKSTRTSQ